MDPTRLMTLDATITPMSVSGRDEYGDDVLTAGSTVAVLCWLHQTQRDETTAGDNVTEQTWTMYLPPTTTVDANDRITVDGVTYEFVGPPGKFTNPRTRQDTHLEATLRRVA